MKIAILILIHKRNNQVEQLIEYLSSDEQINVYIHIDKKTIIEPWLQKPNVHFYKEYKTYWGSYNFIEAMVLLLAKAYEGGNERYLLVSGDDVPVVSNTKMKAFFENNTNEYLDYEKLPREGWFDGGFGRLDYYYSKVVRRADAKNSLDYYWSSSKRLFYAGLRLIMQKTGLRRKYNFKPYGGELWFNLTQNCVGQMLSHLEKDKNYLKQYKYTLCADELFFQSLIANYVTGVTVESTSLRYIDWSTAEKPKVLVLSDYDKIISSKALYARKCIESRDAEIIAKLYAQLN